MVLYNVLISRTVYTYWLVVKGGMTMAHMTDEQVQVTAGQVWTMLTADGMTLVDILGVCTVLLGMVRHTVAKNTGRIVTPEGN